MPPSAAAQPYDPVRALQEIRDRVLPGLQRQFDNDPLLFPPEYFPAPQEGRRAPDLVGDIATAPAPRGGVVSGRGARYPDLVPNNLVQGTSVPINFSDVLKNKTDISIGRARKYIAVVGTRAPKEFCGNVRSLAAACPEKPGEHTPKLILQTCGRRACDTCWDTWALRASTRVADCLTGYLTAKWGDVKEYSQDEIERMLPRHVSFHPPDHVLEDLRDRVLKECEHEWQFPYKFLIAFRKLCEKIIQGAGAVGGVMVLHEIRLRDEVRTDNELQTNRYRSVLKGRDWIYKIKYYPHCHTAMFGSLEDAAAFHARTGWTYRNHSTKGPVRNPEGLIYYLLSHGTATEGIHAYSYFGEMSPRRLVKIGERVFRVPEECEQCKQEGSLGPSNLVISYLHKQTLKFQNDDNRDALLRFGRGPPVYWGFDTITDRVYMKAVRIGEYRLLEPGTRWKKPRWIHTGLDKEALDWIRMGGSDDPGQGLWIVGGELIRDRESLDLKFLEADQIVREDWFLHE